jgi:methylenetetrahydrofolate dehydrogenase (NADP+)/methenyltetrahydrofolate cyclohydrolase
VLDGKAVAARVRAEVALRAAAFAQQNSRPPGLAVVKVGANPASAVYVRNKRLACAEVGIESFSLDAPETITRAELLAHIAALNADGRVDGILVQLPLPPHIAARPIIEAVDPAKDVDGFHPLNVGRLADNLPVLTPCTPRGCMKLLALSGVTLRGARAIVLGRSAIVGKPVATLLLAADATVTIAHSRTKNLAEECRRADIVVAAVGRPEMVRGDWIAPGAIVIDVGINRLEDGRLVGDVATEECDHAGAITPVPGGVGPMTIACLLENTVLAAEARRGA